MLNPVSVKRYSLGSMYSTERELIKSCCHNEMAFLIKFLLLMFNSRFS